MTQIFKYRRLPDPEAIIDIAEEVLIAFNAINNVEKRFTQFGVNTLTTDKCMGLSRKLHLLAMSLERPFNEVCKFKVCIPTMANFTSLDGLKATRKRYIQDSAELKTRMAQIRGGK